MNIMNLKINIRKKEGLAMARAVGDLFEGLAILGRGSLQRTSGNLSGDQPFFC